MAWPQAKGGEFLTQRETRETEPTGGFRLVAFGKEDRLREDFPLRFTQKLGIGIVDLATLGAGENLGRQRRKRSRVLWPAR